MTKRKLVASMSESDQEFIKQYNSDVELLYKVVVEIMHDKPECLLSPVMRELVINQAKKVGEKYQKISYLPMYIDCMSVDLK